MVEGFGYRNRVSGPRPCLCQVPLVYESGQKVIVFWMVLVRGRPECLGDQYFLCIPLLDTLLDQDDGQATS